MQTTKSTVKVQLPTEPSYWGQSATKADVERILSNLETMIRSEFSHHADLEFERTATPQGSGVHSADDFLATDICMWIEDNWTAAL